MENTQESVKQEALTLIDSVDLVAHVHIVHIALLERLDILRLGVDEVGVEDEERTQEETFVKIR